MPGAILALDVSADNKVAIRFYEKSGFELEGIRRNATLIDGRYYNLNVMGRLL